MDSTDLLRLVSLIGVLILVAPGVIYGLRNRRTALRNVAIWAALFGVAAVLFWLLAPPK